jgi:hypothetical protein
MNGDQHVFDVQQRLAWAAVLANNLAAHAAQQQTATTGDNCYNLISPSCVAGTNEQRDERTTYMATLNLLNQQRRAAAEQQPTRDSFERTPAKSSSTGEHSVFDGTDESDSECVLGVTFINMARP